MTPAAGAKRARLISTSNDTDEGDSGSDSSTTTTRYDPSHFIVPAGDSHGHSVREWCRVNPVVDHELDAIVTSKKFPFRTKGDLMRWAIWEGIKKLEKMETVPNSMVNVAEVMLEAARQATLWAQFKATLDAVENSVKLYMNSGNEAEALKLLSRCKAEAMKIPEDMWRNQFLEDMKKRFGHVWDRQKKKVRFDVAEKEK